MLRAHKTDSHLSAAGLRFGIAAARYNADLADALLANCLDSLAKAGADMRDIEILRVPGSFEVTAAAARLASSTSETNAAETHVSRTRLRPVSALYPPVLIPPEPVSWGR